MIVFCLVRIPIEAAIPATNNIKLNKNHPETLKGPSYSSYSTVLQKQNVPDKYQKCWFESVECVARQCLRHKLTITGVQMRTNVMASYGATACGLLKAKSRGLWTDGTFQSCFVLSSLEVAQNLYAIVFRIVVFSEKLKDYHEDMQYFAKTALVNSRLNNGQNYCHTITGREWMEPVPTIDTEYCATTCAIAYWM
ncbi:unnamed protein product [Dicrocoelium dendriticum]|nr:unnamed protein product [Dicrocoelium dendriticum]